MQSAILFVCCYLAAHLHIQKFELNEKQIKYDGAYNIAEKF